MSSHLPVGLVLVVVLSIMMRVIYKFSCLGCSACYIGETNRRFATRIREHLPSEKHSHIFNDLKGSENSRSLSSTVTFVGIIFWNDY